MKQNKPLKDKRVSGRITTKQYNLMKKYHVGIGDVLEYYFSSFGTDKKRLEVELTCLKKQLEDLDIQRYSLERQIEKIEDRLGKETVSFLTKSKEGDNNREVCSHNRVRPFKPEELAKIRNNNLSVDNENV